MSDEKILKFRATSGFGKWQKYFPEESVAHPAKINLHLLNYLIQTYTEEGNTILDPMAGTGSTIVLSILNNRNAIGVELEEKFVGWATQAVETVKKEQTLTPKGKGIVICGDSRKLSEVLKEHEEEISSVLFSPPYGEALSTRSGGRSANKLKGIPEEKQDAKNPIPYSLNSSNIGNLHFADSVVFSPPYGLALNESKSSGHGDKEGSKLIADKGLPSVYSRDFRNIGNLPFLAAILFSPPYFGSSGIDTEEAMKKRLDKIFVGRSYVPTQKYDLDESIGNIKDFGVDAVLTSPPYEASLEGTTRHTKGGIPERDKKLAQTGTYANVHETVTRLREHGRSDGKAGGAYGKSLGPPYSPNGENIGNQKKETYLEAMKTVYEQCFLVLKPQGLLILILKNFIRDKKVVPLTEHAVKLCESVGFKLKERLLFKLPTQSFWRRLYSQKYPEVNTADLRFEHILIFEKDGIEINEKGEEK